MFILEFQQKILTETVDTKGFKNLSVPVAIYHYSVQAQKDVLSLPCRAS